MWFNIYDLKSLEKNSILEYKSKIYVYQLPFNLKTIGSDKNIIINEYTILYLKFYCTVTCINFKLCKNK